MEVQKTSKKEDSRYNFTLPEDSKVVEIIVREGSAPSVPDMRDPEKVKISGTLTAPLEWLQKRIGTFNEKEANIIVDREKMNIRLTVNEASFFKTEITGCLELHPKFVQFGINSEKMWEPNALGQFFKMNRAFFPDRNKNAEIVTLLKNFNARVSSNIDKVKNDNGSFADNFSAVVESNLPGKFNISVPIFKGLDKETIEIEIYTSIDGRNVKLLLISPTANELMEEYRDRCIDDVVGKIAELSDDIVIIEQ